MPAENRLMSIEEAAAVLGIKPRTLSQKAWRVRYQIPVVKVGQAVRFDPVRLREWIERRVEHAQENSAQL